MRSWLIEVKVARERGGERWMTSTKPTTYSLARAELRRLEALGYKCRMVEILSTGETSIAQG